MTRRYLKIGFLSFKNYFDPLVFSGTVHSMLQSLRKHAEVVPLGRPYYPNQIRDFVRNLENRRLQRTTDTFKTSRRLEKMRRVVERQMHRDYVDFVFAPVASQELSVVAVQRPIVYASDATSRILIPAYDLKLSAEEAADRENAERRAIHISAGVTYSSNWAAESATRDYGAPPEKIRVIPYGANLDYVPAREDTLKKCGKQPWKFVFIGTDWQRKGGDIALKAFEVLSRSCGDAELTIIGSVPPRRPDVTRLRVIPFLNKRKARDRRILNEIMLSSHFMLFPSRADCSPIALCEAAAYGLPVIASDVGGISTIVTASTGRLLPSNSMPEDYASTILELMGDSSLYRDMVRSSRDRYEEVLNWDKWAKSLTEFSAFVL